MVIGVPEEIKDHEFRVGIVPAGVHALCEAGHTVLVEQSAGEGSGISDAQYLDAGAEIVAEADALWGRAEMVVKVKEPIAPEYGRLRDGLILFCYLHLAPDLTLTQELLQRKVTGVAYETITDAAGHLPLLIPMSEVAGRMSVQVGATYLERIHGGRGVLLGGVPGVLPARVVIIGGGIVGVNAARIAVGMGAEVTIIERNAEQLRHLDDLFAGRVGTLISNAYNIREAVQNADLVIGAVLVPGARAPRLVTREMLRAMHRGAVIVDVAVDQGGCVETSHPTTHSDPTFVVEDVVHYCVANMPGAVPRTSTFALTNVTLPYVLTLATRGVEQATAEDARLRAGVNTYKGYVTHPAVASAEGLPYVPLSSLVS